MFWWRLNKNLNLPLRRVPWVQRVWGEVNFK